MMKIVRILYSAACISLMFFASCIREEPTSWESNVMAPIAHGRITLGDIVPDSLIGADQNGLWHLMLHEDLTNFDLDTLVQIPDTVIKKSFVVPLTGGPFNIPAGQTIINQEENKLLQINGAELKEVIMKSGQMEYSIRSYINGYLDCTYTIPGVTLNGTGTEIFAQTLPGSGANPFVQSGSIDLADHHIDLTGATGFMFNRVYTHLTIASSANAAGPTLVSGSDSVVIELKFVNPIIRYARGYFGQQHYYLNESVNFGNDLNFPDGNLNLQGASMVFNVRNSIGADAQMNFANLSNYSSFHDQTVNLDYSPIYQPLNITRASDNAGNVTSTNYAYSMTEFNSNIDAFIENLPDQFNLQADVLINPLGDVSDGNDFIYTDNTLKATLDLDIPLNIGMQNLTFTDTMDITASADFNAEGNLFLLVNNTFPFSANCDLFLLDRDGNEQMIIQNQLIENAEETSTPGITLPVKSIVTIPIGSVTLDNWNEDHRLLVRVQFNTPQFNSPSGLYTNYYMDFRVVANAEVTLNYD